MSSNPLVLSLFPGIGLFDMAFEEEGFCVVRGPDLLWGGDIQRFHPPAEKFDGVIGGPPCQEFSRLRFLVRKQHGYASRFGNLIPEFERVVSEAAPCWFLAENVPGAPDPHVMGYEVIGSLLSAHWVGSEQRRLRRFSFGTRLTSHDSPLRRFVIDTLALHPVGVGTVTSSDGGRKGKTNGAGTPRYSVSEMLELQGAPLDMFAHSPLTVEGKKHALANGVPLPMGRAVAKAVKRALLGDPHPSRIVVSAE